MPNTALMQLQQQIDAVRAEAYREGYTAGLEYVRDMLARAALPGVLPAASSGAGAAAAADQSPPVEKPASAASLRRTPAARQPRGASRRGAMASEKRPQRGTNARLIVEVLAAMARAARPTEIREALKRDKGVDIAFTSIRHALGQLAARHAVAPSSDGKAWRLLAGGATASDD